MSILVIATAQHTQNKNNQNMPDQDHTFETLLITTRKEAAIYHGMYTSLGLWHERNRYHQRNGRTRNWLFLNECNNKLEDYGSGILLIRAAIVCTAKLAPSMVDPAGAWGYSAGGMFVPFFTHLEAY